MLFYRDKHQHQKTQNKHPKGKRSPLTTILFVENTWKGEYAARLREREKAMESITGYRVKVVEQSGTSLKSMLVRSNPWSGGKCGRFRCLPCEAGVEDSRCYVRNILYESSCISCASIPRSPTL